MARFDVHRNADRKSSSSVPYLLDVQHELFQGLATRLVIPLRPASTITRPITRLNPILRVDGVDCVANVPEMAGIFTTALGPIICAEVDRDAILAAIDFLISGI